MNELAIFVARAVDAYAMINPEVTVLEVLTALEEVRFELTEATLRAERPTLQ